MATTTNYGWETPDDTDLVKDGAAAIRTLGSSIDTTTKNLNPETTTGDMAYRSASANVNTRLALGTAGQVLRVNSGATAPEWATPADQTPLTTKGDLFGFDTADARIPIGTNGHILTADSTETLGLKWAPPAAASGPAFSAYRGTTQQNFSASTHTKVELNAEDFDTDNCFDPTTNYRFTANKAGKYQFNTTLYIQAGTSARLLIQLYKNGSAFARLFDATAPTAGVFSGSALIDLNGTTDYIELYVWSAGTSPFIDFKATGTGTTLSGVWIRS